MTVIIQGAQLRTIAFGQQVFKAAALLPATTAGNLYTIAGGRVLVTSLVGIAATASPATTNTLKISTAPTSGTGADLCTAVSVASKEAGSIITLPNPVASGSNLVVTTAGGNASIAIPWICPTGNITLTTTGTAATGTWQWYLTYVPLDTGASVS